MTGTIEVDDRTYRSLEFAARVASISAGEVVARLVADASMPNPTPSPAGSEDASKLVGIYVDYSGHRTKADFDPDTSRVDITAGPLAGRSFKTPTGAARAVVAHYKPEVSPNRNGWSFWILDDGSQRFLQSLRRS